MGIDDIGGKAAAFWVKAKSALAGNVPEASTPAPAASRPAGDSVDLPNRGQYFAGYAFPASGVPPLPDAATPGALPGATGSTAPSSDTSASPQPEEAKVWAPLVIAPFDSPPASEPPPVSDH